MDALGVELAKLREQFRRESAEVRGTMESLKRWVARLGFTTIRVVALSMTQLGEVDSDTFALDTDSDGSGGDGSLPALDSDTDSDVDSEAGTDDGYLPGLVSGTDSDTDSETGACDDYLPKLAPDVDSDATPRRAPMMVLCRGLYLTQTRTLTTMMTLCRRLPLIRIQMLALTWAPVMVLCRHLILTQIQMLAPARASMMLMELWTAVAFQT